MGHSARTCVTLTRDPLQISSRIDVATRAAQKFVEKPDSFTDESDSHVLLTIRPRDPQRNSVVGDIETSFLRNLVDRAIKELDAAKQVNFFHTISKHPWFGASAGYVFEKFVYAWLFAPPKSGGTALYPPFSWVAQTPSHHPGVQESDGIQWNVDFQECEQAQDSVLLAPNLPSIPGYRRHHLRKSKQLFSNHFSVIASGVTCLLPTTRRTRPRRYGNKYLGASQMTLIFTPLSLA
ncbi:hypothetical protein BJV78DRAFT_810962 [Lactifluus subvellereus]|nr:hypothetical protein BJV78DRAFT_810962 [Lactifluus subvellereus]